tara:strand:+ start:76 stop:651 length:576 start_codon:yes stop_codon:yes gene_type:complete
MKRISITVLCLFIFINVVESVNHNFAEYHKEDNLEIGDVRNYGSVVTLTSDDECEDLNEDGVCDEKGMVGLKLDVPTTGEIIAFVLFIVIIVGFPLFLIFRIVRKLLKWRIYHKNLEIEGEGEVLEINDPLGRNLPVTQDEFIKWKKSGLGKNRSKKREYSVNIKEEVAIIIVFVLLIIFIPMIFNGLNDL